MTEQFTGVLFTFAGVIIVAILGLVGNYFAKRLRSRASEPEMWKRLDDLSIEVYGDDTKLGLIRELAAVKRKATVVGHVLSTVVRQSPVDFIPRIDPGYLSEIDEDTIPATHPWRFTP